MNNTLRERIKLSIHRRINLNCNEELTAIEVEQEAIGATNEILDIIKSERKSIWHNVVEESPTHFGAPIIVLCRNKNKEDGIWLSDTIECWEGKYEPRTNWEDPVKWAYIEDIIKDYEL